MSTTEEKAKKNQAMKEYVSKNRDKINAQRRERSAKLKADPIKRERLLEMGRVRDRKYRDENRDEINIRKKARNWNYNADNAKVYRKTEQNKKPSQLMITAIKARAKRKDLPFDLDKEWYNIEYGKGCSVTGITFDPVGSKTAFVGHVDRTIPKLGYIKSNCKIVCACYNLAKKDWSDDDVMKMAKALVIRGSDA